MRARAGVGAQEAVRTAFRLPFPTSIFEKNAVCPLKVVRRLMGDVVQIGGQRVILAVGSRKRSIVSDGDADIGGAGKVRRLEKTRRRRDLRPSSAIFSGRAGRCAVVAGTHSDASANRQIPDRRA